MKAYFDTEFTGLQKDTDLISIGIIIGDYSFYAEFTDYDKKKVTPWIQDNVIDNLTLKSRSESTFKAIKNPRTNKMEFTCKGSTKYIRELLLAWLDKIHRAFSVTIDFVSDVSHYDFALLVDLLSPDGALNLPEYITAACHDINQDIAQYFSVNEKTAFNMNREKIVEYLYPNEDLVGRGERILKHNALFDAMIISKIDKVISPFMITQMDRYRIKDIDINTLM